MSEFWPDLEISTMSGGLVNGSPVLLRSLVFNGGVVPENVRLAYAANESTVIELAEPPLHVIFDEVSFCSASLLGHFEHRISNPR